MKRFLLLISLILLSSITVSYVYAQTTEVVELPSLLGQIIGFTTFLAAGLYYALMGWIGKIASALSGQKVSVDWDKVLRASVLGLIIGTGAFIYAEYQGQSIHVTDIQEFITQASVNLVAVMTVHRVIIKAYQKNNTNTPDELDSLDRDDIPEEVPPSRP